MLRTLNKKRAATVLLMAALVFGASERQPIKRFLTDSYENIAYHLDPTPQRAFAYGERHFNGSNTDTYDVDRAEYFFNLAAAQDPSLPYVYHELARISFLQGDFAEAMARIDFQIHMHGDTTPNSYYIRGLIEGYMGNYADSVNDYAYFLTFDPDNWAAMNDYAWVLLKADRPKDAASVTKEGIELFPNNPWLLNTNATALYEMNAFEAAYQVARKADAAAQTITQAQWLHAYPGNDPLIAAQGIATFRQATHDNMHMIALAAGTSTVQ